MTSPVSPMRRRLSATATLAALSLLIAGCGGSKGGGSSAPPTGPVVAQLLPVQGPPIGGTTITISGSRFTEGVTGGTTVLVGGVAASNIVVLDDMTLTAVTPAGTADTIVDVRVVNSRGAGVLPSSFRYTGTGDIVGDLNGDGLSDVIVAAPFDGSASGGSVYVFYGGNNNADRTTSQADLVLNGLNADDRFGSSVTTGDLDGDGQDDLIVGAPRNDATGLNAGAVYVFLGPLPNSGVLSASMADIVLTGEGWGDIWSVGDHFGTCIALGDMDGDGHADLLVGAPGMDVNPGQPNTLFETGAAYLFRGGPALASKTAFEADVKITGLEAGDALGASCDAADLSGDGIADVVLGAPSANPQLPGIPKKWDGGAVYVFEGGPQLQSGSVTTATATFTPEHGGDELGTSISAGDVDGDGFEDLVVSAMRSNAVGSNAGRVYVLRGGNPLVSRAVANADFIFSGQQSNGRFGAGVTVADFNGDGYEDVLVGAPHNSAGAIRNGRTYLFCGGPHMQDELAHFADVVTNGETIDGQYFGSGLEVVDHDQDGIADAVVGATGNSAGAPGGGRAYTFDGTLSLEDMSATEDAWTLTGTSPWGKFGHAISRGK